MSHTPLPTPNHIAVILDGNNRWQQKRTGTKSGHEAGADAVEPLVDGALAEGVSYLTLFAFSTENWHREEAEVMHLLRLFRRVATDKKVIQRFNKQGVRFATIGDIDAFARYLPDLPRSLHSLAEHTQNNTKLTVTAALNYGGRWDIVKAARSLAEAVERGQLSAEQIDEQQFANRLATAQLHLPDPDLLIRTSDELRLSNFLLWQCAYSELYFTDCLWPDFTKDDLRLAIAAYQSRHRRFGGR